MSLNWTMLNPNRSPVPLKNEMTVTTINTGVDLALTIPDVPPSSSSSAGGSGGTRRLKALGKIWLTDQRVCSPFSGQDCISMLIRLTLCIYLSHGTSSYLYRTPMQISIHYPFHYIPFCWPNLNNRHLPLTIWRSRSNLHLEAALQTEQVLNYGSKIERCSSLLVSWKRQESGQYTWLDNLEMKKKDCVSRCAKIKSLPVINFARRWIATYTTPAESSSVSMVGGIPVENPPGYDV